MKKYIFLIFLFAAQYATAQQQMIRQGKYKFSNLYATLGIITDTTSYKPAVVDASGKLFKGYWFPTSGGGGSDGNNYPTSLGYSADVLTLGRSGLSDLTASLPFSSKLNISDTAAMLTNYKHWGAGYLTSFTEADPTAVHLTGNETIAGLKTFSSNVTSNAGFYGNAYVINTLTGTMGSPGSGKGTYYFKTDKLPYAMNGDGTEMPLSTGGWTVHRVSGSNATTTGQTLTDITGLVSATLTNSTLYEVEVVLYVTTSNVTTGTQYAIAAGGSGGAAEVFMNVSGTTTTNAATTVTQAVSGTAVGTFLTTSSASGIITIKGFVLTRGAGTANISVQHLKVTSGTSTVKIGSVLRYRLAS